MYSLIRPYGLEKNPKLVNVGPTSIPESRVDVMSYIESITALLSITDVFFRSHFLSSMLFTFRAPGSELTHWVRVLTQFLVFFTNTCVETSRLSLQGFVCWVTSGNGIKWLTVNTCEVPHSAFNSFINKINPFGLV